MLPYSSPASGHIISALIPDTRMFFLRNFHQNLEKRHLEPLMFNVSLIKPTNTFFHLMRAGSSDVLEFENPDLKITFYCDMRMINFLVYDVIS